MRGLSFEDPNTDRMEKRIKELTEQLNQMTDVCQEQAKLLAHQDRLLSAVKSAKTFAKDTSDPDERYRLTIGQVHKPTDVLGEKQGYRPLPVHRGYYHDEEGRPVRSAPFTDTAWVPSDDQREMIMDGAPLIVRLGTHEQPAIMVMVGVWVEAQQEQPSDKVNDNGG